MTSRIGASLPLYVFPENEIQLHNPLRAELMAKLAGNTRFFAEWTNGARQVAGVPACAPISYYSSVEPGHDHSGGVMGRPLRYTFWSAMYGNADAALGANFSGGRCPQIRVYASEPGPYNLIDTRMRGIWIAKCPPDGHFFNAELNITLSHTDDADLFVEWENFGHVNSQLTSVVGAGDTTLQFSDTFNGKVSLRPGSLQFARLRILATYSGSDSVIALRSATLDQVRQFNN